MTQLFQLPERPRTDLGRWDYASPAIQSCCIANVNTYKDIADYRTGAGPYIICPDCHRGLIVNGKRLELAQWCSEWNATPEEIAQ